MNVHALREGVLDTVGEMAAMTDPEDRVRKWWAFIEQIPPQYHKQARLMLKRISKEGRDG